MRHVHLLLTAFAAIPASGAESITQLPAITVTAESEPGYAPRNADTATKTDTPIGDVPAAIEVRDRQLLDDLGGARNVYEVGRTVAGVVDTAHGNGSPGIDVPVFVIRGYSTQGVVLRDGAVRVNGWLYTMDLADIERVEFLKGPASALYGSPGQSGSFGGLINYVSKEPLATRLAEAEATVGSHDFHRGSVDLNLPADASAMRLNAAFTDAGGFIERTHTRTWLVAPAISARLGDRDTLTVRGEFVRSDATPATPLPLAEESFGVGYRRNFGDREFARIGIDAVQLGTAYQHRFSDTWSLEVDASLGHATTTDAENNVYLDAGGTGTWHLTGSRWDFRDTAREVDARLQGRLAQGAVAHDLLIGLDWQSDSYHVSSASGGAAAPDLDLGTAVLAEVRAPSPGSYAALWAGATQAPGGFVHDTRSLAPYVQDLLRLGSQVKVLAGLRLDRIASREATSDAWLAGNPESDRIEQTSSHLSPRLGLLWKPVPSTSAYASYSQGFVPNVGLTRAHEPLDPEQGQLLEAGLKHTQAEHLTAYLAVYQITQQNLAQSDPDNAPDESFLVLLGKTRSRGLEFDLDGRIGSAVRLSLAAALMRAEVVGPDLNGAMPAGNVLGNVPARTLNVLGVYSFSGALAGLEAGAGGTYLSRMYADTAHSLLMPEIYQLDAMLSYRLDRRWSVRADLKNLTDHRNYTADWGGSINRGQPLMGFVSVKAEL